MAGFRVKGPMPPEWRDYKLVCLTGWTEEEILDQRAEWLDWILTYDSLVAETMRSPSGVEIIERESEL